MRKGLKLGLASLVAATVLGTVPATAAFARPESGGRGIQKSGPCSAASTWKLKASPDNGRIEVQFEVDSNVVGQTWNVVLKDNGTAFFRGTATTQSPSGSFEVRKFATNQAGSDKIQGKATLPSTGEVCQGSVTL